jgi:hypothetical protein
MAGLSPRPRPKKKEFWRNLYLGSVLKHLESTQLNRLTTAADPQTDL